MALAALLPAGAAVVGGLATARPHRRADNRELARLGGHAPVIAAPTPASKRRDRH